MGKRGPKPAPTETKRARGNPGHRPLNDEEPVLPAADVADLTPPAGLGKVGKEEWSRLAPMLSSSGVLTAGDMRCFETYCRIVDDVAAYAKLAAGVKPDEALKLGYAGHLLKLRAQLKQYLAELGGTPSSRSGVKVNHQGWKPPEAPGAKAADARKRRFFGRKLRLDPPASA